MTMYVQKVEFWIIPSKFKQNRSKKMAIDIDGLKTLFQVLKMTIAD
jgi:hypothetical protein